MRKKNPRRAQTKDQIWINILFDIRNTGLKTGVVARSDDGAPLLAFLPLAVGGFMGEVHVLQSAMMTSWVVSIAAVSCRTAAQLRPHSVDCVPLKMPIYSHDKAIFQDSNERVAGAIFRFKSCQLNPTHSGEYLRFLAHYKI